MAGKKRKSAGARASFESTPTEAAEVENPNDCMHTPSADLSQGSSRSRQTPSSSARVRKTPRPSVEIVEVDTDEERQNQQPRLEGVLRGLNPDNVLPTTQNTIEISDDDEIPIETSQVSKHTTRQTRHGRAEVNYDMKASIKSITE